VVPVIPDELSSRGVTHFKNLVEKKIDEKLDYLRTSAHVQDKDVPQNFVSKTRLAAIVPSLAKYAGNAASGFTNLHTEQIAALRRNWKTDVIQTVGKNMTGVPEAVNAGVPVWNFQGNNVTDDVEEMMTKICTELKTRIDQ
jgi:chromosome partitioning protein